MRRFTVKRSRRLPKKTRRKAYLIHDPYEIAEITGRFVASPKPRCSICKKPTRPLPLDRGAPFKRKARRVEIARYCEGCEIIFPLQKWVVVAYGPGVIEK